LNELLHDNLKPLLFSYLPYFHVLKVERISAYFPVGSPAVRVGVAFGIRWIGFFYSASTGHDNDIDVIISRRIYKNIDYAMIEY